MACEMRRVINCVRRLEKIRAEVEEAFGLPKTEGRWRISRGALAALFWFDSLGVLRDDELTDSSNPR